MDQKERIIEQAMHMFVSQGIKSVRMDDIAQQLGVSKRTLYELFGDKEGLLYLAMDRYFEKKRIERVSGPRQHPAYNTPRRIMHTVLFIRATS